MSAEHWLRSGLCKEQACTSASTTVHDYNLHGEAKLPYACAAQTRLAWETEVQTSGDIERTLAVGRPAGAAVPCGEIIKIIRCLCLECLFILSTCVFTCIQFESPKSAEYTYSKAYPRVFRM